MTFWSSPQLSPLRRRNFRIQITNKDDSWWWAKTVTKPSFEVNINEYQLVNKMIKYPGLLVWNDVTITIVDVGKKAKEFIQQLGINGYIPPNVYKGKDGIAKYWKQGSEREHIIIKQYADDLTTPEEQWHLANAMVRSISFGELSYADDEFVEIQIVIAYDWAVFDDGTSEVQEQPKAITPAIRQPTKPNKQQDTGETEATWEIPYGPNEKWKTSQDALKHAREKIKEFNLEDGNIKKKDQRKIDSYHRVPTDPANPELAGKVICKVIQLMDASATTNQEKKPK